MNRSEIKTTVENAINAGMLVASVYPQVQVTVLHNGWLGNEVEIKANTAEVEAVLTEVGYNLNIENVTEHEWVKLS